MDNFYRENILDHFKNPRNFGRLKNPDFSHEENNPLCGDRIGMEIKVKSLPAPRQTWPAQAGQNAKVKSIIKEIKFYGEGCAISMAAASMLTEKILGREIKKIKKLGPKDILKMLGISPTPTRLKCVLLPLEVLQKALS